MGNSSTVGRCHICLRRGPLTYEHVPPRRAYNACPVVAHVINHPAPGNVPFGTVANYRAGMGVSTLCSACNGFTARHYGPQFAEWIRQALTYADRYTDRGGTDNSILIPFTIEPLAVLKQIATMVLAVAPISGNDAFVGLRQFVLVPFARWEPSDVSVRVYLNPKRSGWTEPQNRMAGVSAMYDFNTPGKFAFKLADIAFPPLGYVAAIMNEMTSTSADFHGLAEINHFGFYGYGKETTVFLPMPVRTPVGPVRFDGID